MPTRRKPAKRSTMDLTTRARHILALAADHLEAYGWQQHDFGQKGGPCCLIGSILAMTTPFVDEPCRQRALRILEQAIYPLHRRGDGAPDHRSLILWNDAPGRTAQEVIDVMRQAAGI